MAEKICYQPCLGVNPVETTVGRQAGYALAEELRPGQVALGCGPALNAMVQEDIDFITHYPVIAVEGCEKRCAQRLVEKFEQKVAVSLVVPDVLREAGINLAAEKGLAPNCVEAETVNCCAGKPDPTTHLDLTHPTVQTVAKRAAEELDRLLTG